MQVVARADAKAVAYDLVETMKLMKQDVSNCVFTRKVRNVMARGEFRCPGYTCKAVARADAKAVTYALVGKNEAKHFKYM